MVGDGDVRERMAILDRIEQLRPTTIVPGRGPVAGPEAIAFVRQYLADVASAEPCAPVPERYASLGFPEVWERNLAALHS